MKIQIMKRITLSNLLTDALPQVNTRVKARKQATVNWVSGPERPRAVCCSVEAPCPLAEDLRKGHLPARSVHVVWPGFLWVEHPVITVR